jgi:NADP-dependent 3-hydroxy acid dehydrogenase YdfG
MSRAIAEGKANQRFKQASRIGSFQSLVSLIQDFFKLLQQILLLPKTMTVKLFFTRKWTPHGRTILITGASSGIGCEMARQFASQGARLALVSRTSEDLERVAKECRELGSSKALHYAADLSNATSTQLAMQQAISDFGRFDVVVLNAGRAQGCYFEEIKDAKQIDQLIKLNVNGAIITLHCILPHVPKSKDSRIVVVSNTAGIVAAPYQSVYSATKFALTGFSNSLRMELNHTYGREAPKVCLVSFPEVSGTKINASRMNMGAKLPSAKWYSWAGVPLTHAVHSLLPAIASGKREFGQPYRFNIWRSLYPVCPQWVDAWMWKNVQRTHYRPIDETVKHGRTTMMEAQSISQNRSWAG